MECFSLWPAIFTYKKFTPFRSLYVRGQSKSFFERLAVMGHCPTPKERSPTPVEFFGCNRFLLHLLRDYGISTIAQAAQRLDLPTTNLRSNLLGAKLPVRWSHLQLFTETRLPDPPPVCRECFASVREDRLLDDIYLKLLFPVTAWHFDFTTF